MIRIAINGAGRMARAIVDAAASRSGVNVVALVSPYAPADGGEWAEGIPIFAQLGELDQKPSVLIDFSLPEGTLAAAEYCGAACVPLVSGVTGLPVSTQAALSQVAERAPVLWSANLSVGVNLLAELCKLAAARLEPDTPVVIDDLHHAAKLDAPSGTALMLGSVIEAARQPASPRVTYHSVREGAHVGAHEVRFEMGGERIVLGHIADDRAIFARGALAAAIWLSSQTPGRYTASDWLRGSALSGNGTAQG